MKISFLIYSLSSGGAERVTSSLANYWSKNDNEINIITIAGQDLDFYELNRNVNRVSLNQSQIGKNLFNRLINNIKRILKIRKLLKTLKPDVVISMMDTANIYLAIAATGLPIIKIGSERTYPPAHDIGKIWNIIRRLVYRSLNCIVVQTKKTAAWVEKLPGNIYTRIIPNPVIYPLPINIENQKFVDSVIKKNEKYVLAVGRIVKEKNYPLLLNSFKKSGLIQEEWKLVIIGEGYERDNIIKLINDLEINDSVKLVGLVGNLSDWYQSASVFSLTSEFEGFPNTLLEAMAYGVPVVSVDCDAGPSDIITNYVNGILIRNYDEESLSNALYELASDKQLADKLSHHAKVVRKKYSIETISGLWFDLIYSIKNKSYIN